MVFRQLLFEVCVRWCLLQNVGWWLVSLERGLSGTSNGLSGVVISGPICAVGT